MCLFVFVGFFVLHLILVSQRASLELKYAMKVNK